jgi:hypothetical protein
MRFFSDGGEIGEEISQSVARRREGREDRLLKHRRHGQARAYRLGPADGRYLLQARFPHAIRQDAASRKMAVISRSCARFGSGRWSRDVFMTAACQPNECFGRQRDPNASREIGSRGVIARAAQAASSRTPQRWRYSMPIRCRSDADPMPIRTIRLSARWRAAHYGFANTTS